MIRELEVAEIEAKAGADAGDDRHHEYIPVAQHRHPKAGNHIRGARHAIVAPIDRVHVGEIVDQHHDPVAVATNVDADARALPENLALAGILGTERAFAIAQAADDGAGAFLAEDVAVGQAMLRNRSLDDAGQPLRDAAEKLVAGIEDFVGRILARRVRPGDALAAGGGGCDPGKSDKSEGKRGRGRAK